MRQNSTVSSVAASSRRILATAVQGVASRLFGPARTQLRATPRACEMLERRHLLTDIFGGETFTYESFDFGTISDDGEIETITVRVEVQGNSDTVVKLHGVGQGGGGGFVMSDLSGEIVSPIPGRSGPTRGGVGGLLGSTKLIDDEFVFVSELGGIQRYNLADYIGSIIPSLAGPALLATQDLITFDEIATTSTGQNFGLQLVDVQLGDLNVRQLQIAEFNTDTSDFDPNGASTNRTPGFGGDLGLRTNVGDALFRGDIIESIIAAVRAVESPDSFPPEDPMDPLADRALITSLIGADFALGDDDTLYVAAMVTVGRAASNINPIIADVDVPFIFAIDMNTLSPGGASAVAIASDFWGDPQSLDAQTVAGDVTAFGALDSDTFAMFGEFTERISEGTQQQALVPVTGLLLQDISTAQVRQLIDPDDVVPLALGGDQINRLEALQFRPDSPGFTPATTLERLYALTEGAGAGGGGEDQFIIRFNGGFFGDFTVIGGLGDVDGTTSGDSVLSLSWDPAIANPFDGGTGAFVAFDIGTDQFLVVDQRPRGVTSSSLALFNIQVLNSDDSTRITSYAVDDNGEPITLEDNPNPLAAVFNPESGEVELVEAPEGSGALYLGLKFVSDEDPPSVFTVDSLDPTEFTEGSDPFTGKLYNGRIRPGLYTVNGSLGSFFYAGIVTGNVRIEGALGEFWAGAITTGDAGLTGAGEPDNFAVFGDAGNIISATSIGVEKVVGDAPAIDSDDIPLRYSSRTEIAIGGRVNSIRGAGAIAAAIDVRGDDPAPGTDLSGTFFKRRPAGPLRELERQGNDEEADNLFIAGTPRLTNYYNDNLANYEPIGTLGNGTIQINGLISGDAADASRDDSVDYFGIGMMGGQEFEVQLTSPGSAPTASLQVAVFDPDGRMIASDYEDNGIAINSRRGQAMRIKATVPGVYRIAIAPAPDADFNEAGGDFADQLYTTEPYFLTVRNAGNITLGGIKAQGHVYAEANTVNGQDFLRLWRGDLGVVESMTGTILAFGAPPNIRVNTGSLRQLSGASLGWYTTDPNEDIGFINVRVPKGSIGALRAFGSDGDFAGDIFFNWSGVFDGDNLPLVSEAIGDDIQLVQATRDVLGNFIVGRGIGSIVAARDWGAPLSIPFGSPNNTGGAIFTNVDDLGDDGFLDILSVGGNVGQDTTNGRLLGGPAIDMGTNGNFRYFDFAPGGNLVRDPLFGISTGDPFQTLNPGETFEFVDDSGTAVSVIPIAGDEPNPNDPNDNPQATLSVLTYPVRSGGSILVTVNTTNGVEVTTNSRGPRATVEVGNIRTAGTGRPVRRDIDPNFPEGDPELVLGDSFFDPGDPLDLNDPFEDIFMRFSGTNVDIFSIDATTTAGEGGSFTEIVNNTTGELLDITGASIGTLRANRLGIPLTRGASDLRAVQNRTSFYPFNLQPYLIGVDGSIITVEAEQMGNIYAGIAQGFTIGGPEDGGDGGDGGGGDGGGGDGGGGDGGGGDGGGGGPAGIGTGTGNGNGNGGASPPPSIGSAGDGIGGLDAGNTGGGVGGIGTEVIGELAGIIGTVRPNRDGQDDPNRFEGINGPIVVATPDSGRVDGEFTLVDIGEGVLPSGSGNVGFAGLWAEGFIVEIVGNNGADIRGDVVANEINSIRLNGGSIVHADILAAPVAGNSPANADFTTTRELEIARGALPGFVEAGPEDADTVFYEFDQIEITGGGGIIGARIAAPDIFNVLVSDGFGIINSTMITLVEGEVELVDTDGLGIRNSIIGQGRDVGTVIARGDAELLNLNDFSGTVDFSGEGLVFDPFSGFALTAINDLRKALGLPDDVDPRRKRVTNSGVMENVIISGSRDIDRVEAIVMRSNLDSFNPLGTFEQTAEGFGGGNAQSPDHPMSIDFGRTITDIQTRSTHGVRVESGDLVRMNADWDVFNTEVRISGEIGDVTIGQDLWRDSSVRADGPDGFLNAITANNIYGFVSGDVGIGTMTVHNDLFSPTDAPATVLVTPSTVRALSRIDSIIVGRHIRTGAYIRSTEEIGLLQVGGDIQAGSVVQASQIDDLQVTGNIFGDIVLTS